MQNRMEPKEKKRKKKHDLPREYNGKDAPPGETTDVAPEQPQKEASRVNGSPEGHKRSENSGDESQSKTQPPIEGIPETLADKKVRKRKKEKGEKTRLKQGDVSKETITPPEPVAASVDDSTKDEKKVKKRKHKEKKEEGAEADHDSTAATKLEPSASQMDDAKGERKRKGKEEKATGEKRKHEDTVANDVEKRRKHR